MGELPVLGIRHYEASGERLAELTWDGAVCARAPFHPVFDRFDVEDLRWYYEDYRQNWGATSNAVIERIQRAERRIGEAIHEALFADDAKPISEPASEPAREKVRLARPDLRVEIRDEAPDAAVPWELITDPGTGEPLALTASSFVRASTGTPERPSDQVTRDTFRLLMLISRPDGAADVDYWSIAYQLWQALPRVKVDVLRPPTFDALEDRLSEAARDGNPYTAVHFDGHGVVGDPFGGGRARGYLAFETPGRAGAEFIDGTALGEVLAETGVLLFSMNACRSADSEAADRRLHIVPEPAAGQPSIVEDLLAAGVPSCVGMRRDIYPATAARFFGAFYPAFFGGHSAGEAARTARRLLREQPLAATTMQTQIAPVSDWSIPVVGEREPIRLTAVTAAPPAAPPAAPAPTLPAELSAPPLAGFGRAVLELEDALADASVVLVHGSLLSGKSRLAVEYARWLSATSPQPRPVRYIRLSAADPPPAVDCHNARGDIFIFDQADGLTPETQAFLAEMITGLDATCRVLVTARSDSLPWLPPCRGVVPDTLRRDDGLELGQRWAEALGARFDRARHYPLLLVAGGRPGLFLLLLGAARSVMSSGKASAHDVADWLYNGEWDKVCLLASDPGFGLPTVDAIVTAIAADLSAACDQAGLAAIRSLSRFEVAFDEDSAAHLVASVHGEELPLSPIVGALVSAGLAEPCHGAEPAWLVHPLLALVASRLDEASRPDDEILQVVFIDTVARKAAELAARFRFDTAAVVDILRLYRQDIRAALDAALKRDRLPAAAALIEALGLYCRFTGDVDQISGVLDRALPRFIDTGTGELAPGCGEAGLKVWDQAIWICADWPRRRGMGGGVRLAPPAVDDHYRVGLWLRAVGAIAQAAVAFQAELDAPARHPRYAPGDVECHLAELSYLPDQPRTWEGALRACRRSHEARLPQDALGQAWSRIAEARIRMAMLFSREDSLADDDVAGGAELGPEDLAELDQIAGLLREAQSRPGGRGAENRSQAAMLWSRIMLAHGDLTSAISHFEEGSTVLMALEEGTIWVHYWWFARDLIRYGWIARGYEYAVNAFQFAMQVNNHQAATGIREYCQRLEATHPELTS